MLWQLEDLKLLEVGDQEEEKFEVGDQEEELHWAGAVSQGLATCQVSFRRIMFFLRHCWLEGKCEMPVIRVGFLSSGSFTVYSCIWC